MRWPWQRRSPRQRLDQWVTAADAWQPELGAGVWRTWYAECCDTLLAFERVSATLPERLRATVEGLAEQLRPLLDAARGTAELAARLDPHGPWPDHRLAAMLADDTIADLSGALPPTTATTRLADRLEQQRLRLEAVVDELTRLAAQAYENPAATDVGEWLAALAAGVQEASRAGWTSATLPTQRLAPPPAPAAGTTPIPEQESTPLAWDADPAVDRVAAGLPEPPPVQRYLLERYLAAEYSVLRYQRAVAAVTPETPAATALTDGWPDVYDQLSRVIRLCELTDRAPWHLPPPRRRGPRRTRYPAGARHLHNLHRALVALELSANAAVGVAVAAALAGDVESPDTARVGQSIAALATALTELAAATPHDG